MKPITAGLVFASFIILLIALAYKSKVSPIDNRERRWALLAGPVPCIVLGTNTNKIPKMELRERSEVLTNWTDSISSRTAMWCGYEDLCNVTTFSQTGVVVSNIVATLTDGSGRAFTATQQIVLTNLTRTFVRQLIKRFPDGSMELERTL